MVWTIEKEMGDEKFEADRTKPLRWGSAAMELWAESLTLQRDRFQLKTTRKNLRLVRKNPVPGLACAGFQLKATQQIAPHVVSFQPTWEL